MPSFEYSRYDGSEQFSPQSADEIFDQFSQYLMGYGEDMLDELEQLEEQNPDVVDMLIKRGYVEKDRDGKFTRHPQGDAAGREQGAGRTVRRSRPRQARPARHRASRGRADRA